MRIADSAAQLSVMRRYVVEQSRRESVRAWVGPQRPSFDEAGAAAPAGSAEDGGGDAALSPKLGMLKLLLERLFGVRVRLHGESEAKDPAASAQAGAQVPDAPRAPQRQGWGAEIAVTERAYESETTDFTASGVVKTTDGQDVSFSLSLSMRREYLQEASAALRAGDATVDPLVINFDGTAAQLSDVTFRFDLQGDGQAEEVSTLGAGSGFLALDRNGDGVINDGGELFGPPSGDGFADLSRYDADGNRWIDESDPVYGQLRIWQPDGSGGGPLATLGEKQVGAIYLGHAETPFAVKDTGNSLQGQIVASGVYLADNGTAGSVQQVDLAV